MEYKHLKAEQQREMLRNELNNLETQHWARNRDKAKWLAIDPDNLRASAVDARIAEAAKAERTAELARCEYDLEKLEGAIANAEAELAALGPKG